MRRQISIEEIVDTAVRRLRDSLYHCMPGIVVSYYATEKTVDVQPGVNDVRFDTTTAERISEPWTIVPHVPVAWPKFGGMAVWGELAPGDKVILIGFDLDPGQHRSTGSQADPADTRRHGGGYWVAFPGDITDAGVLPDAGANAIAIGKIATMTDHVALATKTDANLETLRAQIAAAVGSAPVSTLPQVAAILNAFILLFNPPGVLGTAQGTVASTTVKVSP